MSPAREAQVDDLDVLTAKESPAGLAWLIGGKAREPENGWVPYSHLVLLSDKLMQVAAGELPRLIVTMPPRHGKSELISRTMPAWFLGRFPDRKVMLASYEATFAKSWGRKARAILEEYGRPVFGVNVAQGSSAADWWEIDGRRGVMTTAGVGGALTGKGADLLIIDDPVKNAEESMSDVMREKAWDWWVSTARTRLQKGGAVVIVMTRWHSADLAGKLLQEADDGGEQWELLNLPALAGEDDPIGRKPGEALCPELFDEPTLQTTKRAMGSYFWAALYQQTPTPDEGGIFARKHFRYFSVEGDQAVLRLAGGETKTWAASECRKLTYADLAVSEKQTADYTVAAEVWVTPERELLVRQIHRDRIPGPDQPDFFRDHLVGTLKVEEIGYQAALIQALLRSGLPVEPVHPDKDKVTRASAAGAMYRAGRVYHLAGAEWLGDFELELLAFPAGEHDDQVDALAYAARDVATLQLGVRKQKRRGRTETGGLLGADL